MSASIKAKAKRFLGSDFRGGRSEIRMPPELLATAGEICGWSIGACVALERIDAALLAGRTDEALTMVRELRQVNSAPLTLTGKD